MKSLNQLTNFLNYKNFFSEAISRNPVKIFSFYEKIISSYQSLASNGRKTRLRDPRIIVKKLKMTHDNLRKNAIYCIDMSTG